MKKIIIIFIMFLLLVGCSSNVTRNISGSDALSLVENESAILVDVRTSLEYQERHIKGAINIPLNEIDSNILESLIENKDKKIVIYCASGNRSSRAITIFENYGYNNIYDLGSINNWGGEFE